MHFYTDIVFLNVLLMAAGFLMLVKGSDWFVESSADISRKYNIPQMVVGLTIVSIGTSLPELATNVYATITGEVGIALGNILGSNIANVYLVLGIAVVLYGRISISRKFLNRDGLFLLGIYLLFAVFAWFPADTHMLNTMECGVFLLLLVGYCVYLFTNTDVMQEEMPEEAKHVHFTRASVAWLFLGVGLICIIVGAKLIVDNVVKIANDFDIPKPIISATVVAFGTSVPELAVTISGVIKKKNAIALGNIVGSCIFNILLVLGAVGVLSNVDVDSNSMFFLTPLMVSSGALLLLFMRTGRALVRVEGVVFLVLYSAYIAYNVVLM